MRFRDTGIGNRWRPPTPPASLGGLTKVACISVARCFFTDYSMSAMELARALEGKHPAEAAPRSDQAAVG
jgi:hypothetical protein